MQAQVKSTDQTRYATLLQRFAAVTIDELITMIAFVPAFVVELTGRGGNWLLILLMVTAAVLRYSYFALLEHRNGQTLGKQLFRIKVRSEREDRLPLMEALVRNLRRFDVLAGFALPSDPNTATTAARIVVAALLFYTVVAPIFIWQSEKKQRPLDMLVHTIVVQTEQPRTPAA